MNKIYCQVLSLLMAMSLYAQPVETFTLDEVISMTLDHNFSIQLAKNEVEIGINNNTYGNAGFLPVIDASANYNRSTQNTEQEFVSGTGQSVDGAKRETYGAGVDLTWTLFDGTRMFATKDRLESEALLNQQQLKIQVDIAIANVMTQFYGLAIEQERLALFESNIDFSSERVRIVQEKYNVGKESKLALLQAKVDFNADQSSMLQQRELLTTQRLALIREMGVEPSDFLLEYSMEIDTTLVLDVLLLEAQNQNSQLHAQMINRQVIEHQVKEIDRSKWPELNFNLGYGYSNLESEAGFLSRNQTYDFRYGVSATVTLFSGFNFRRQLENARVLIENNQIQTSQLENQVATELAAAYTTYRNNLELIKLESENLNVAIENSEIALERFRLGASDPLELREAQVNGINAQLRLLQAQFNAKLAEIRLLQLSGRLSSQTDK